LQDVLVTLYPNHPWDRSQFGLRVRSGWWAKDSNRLEFLEGVAKRLEITDLSGWYDVSKQQMINMGGTLNNSQPLRIVDKR